MVFLYLVIQPKQLLLDVLRDTAIDLVTSQTRHAHFVSSVRSPLNKYSVHLCGNMRCVSVFFTLD